MFLAGIESRTANEFSTVGTVHEMVLQRVLALVIGATDRRDGSLVDGSGLFIGRVGHDDAGRS